MLTEVLQGELGHLKNKLEFVETSLIDKMKELQDR